MKHWLILTATLPTTPGALRVRVWRMLKSTHCASLREGVYLLPAAAPVAPVFREMDEAIRAAGAQSHLLEVTARDAAQEASFVSLFDRDDRYAEFAQALKDARKRLLSVKPEAEADARKQLRALDAQLQGILQADFFPGVAAQKAAAGLQALRHEVGCRLSPGEPSVGTGGIPVLAREAYVGRTWATRSRPWVDRLASAWLIQRFVDPQAVFVWLATAKKCPKGALGYDFDGATFTHVGERVTFEVLLASFALEADPALRSLGALVHCIDAGGAPVDEAPGLELLVRGLQASHMDDHALLAAALPVFDALYVAFRETRL